MADAFWICKAVHDHASSTTLFIILSFLISKRGPLATILGVTKLHMDDYTKLNLKFGNTIQFL